MLYLIRSILLYLSLTILVFSFTGCTSTKTVSRPGLAAETEVFFSSRNQQGLITLDERIQFEALKAANIYSSKDTLYWDDPDNGDLCAAHLKDVKIITLFNKRRGMQNGMLVGAAAGGLLTLLLSESQSTGNESKSESIGIQGIAAGVFAGGLAGILVGAFSGSPDNYRLSDNESDYRNLKNGSDKSIDRNREKRKRRKRVYRLEGE